MQCGKIAQWGAPWASTRLNDSPIRENNREVDNPILHSSIPDSIGATAASSHHATYSGLRKVNTWTRIPELSLPGGSKN